MPQSTALVPYFEELPAVFTSFVEEGTQALADYQGGKVYSSDLLEMTIESPTRNGEVFLGLPSIPSSTGENLGGRDKTSILGVIVHERLGVRNYWAKDPTDPKRKKVIMLRDGSKQAPPQCKADGANGVYDIGHLSQANADYPPFPGTMLGPTTAACDGCFANQWNPVPLCSATQEIFFIPIDPTIWQPALSLPLYLKLTAGSISAFTGVKKGREGYKRILDSAWCDAMADYDAAKKAYGYLRPAIRAKLPEPQLPDVDHVLPHQVITRISVEIASQRGDPSAKFTRVKFERFEDKALARQMAEVEPQLREALDNYAMWFSTVLHPNSVAPAGSNTPTPASHVQENVGQNGDFPF